MGVTLASKLNKNTNLSVCLIESKQNVGLVQTNKNSGVVHSGIFYRDSQNILPFCLDGKQRVIDYCLKYDLPIKLTGKNIKFSPENKQLLIDRCEQYSIPYELNENFIKLHDVCLVDYQAITKHQYENCKDKIKFYFNKKAKIIDENNILIDDHNIKFDKLVNLTGINANDIYRKLSKDYSFTVCEIIGRYHEFNCDFPTMIYNGPDKKLPFLGVHITPTFNKTIKLGPDAFPIIYSKSISNNLKDLARRTYFYFKNFKYFNKNLLNNSPKNMIIQSRELFDLNLTMNDYIKATTGIRSVLLNSKGELEKNFIFIKYKNTFHFLNSHSPAATCSFTIADYIMNQIL